MNDMSPVGNTGKRWSDARRSAFDRRLTWTPARKKRLTELWNAGADVKDIAAELRTSRGAIYTKAHQQLPEALT